MKKKNKKNCDIIKKIIEVANEKKISSYDKISFPWKETTIDKFPFALKKILQNLFSKTSANYKSLGIKYENEKIDYYTVVIDEKTKLNDNAWNLLTKTQYFVRYDRLGNNIVLIYREPSHKDMNDQSI